MECFQAIYPLVHAFMPVESHKQFLKAAHNDRLVQLLLKGLLYETAVEFCQTRAFSEKALGDIKVDSVLDGYPLDNVDASLLAWLEQLSAPVFKVPFEQKNLNVQLAPLKRPELQAHWTQQILLSPIVPQKFPFTAVPLNRIKSAEKMSRSLIPYYDGLTSGLDERKPSAHSIVGPKIPGMPELCLRFMLPIAS
ncbi:unnamed protein product [Soboliphyme baturini]|uniref:LisH domain-containing protein n=1 Tax=Soboliphyme baturini TaxID=241478 RepID=A0A183J5C9_9BILA|nr:unnamed protein product [Soboliphyme baturini]